MKIALYCIFSNHALPLFNLLDRGLPLLWQQCVNFRLSDPNGEKLQNLACLEGRQQKSAIREKNSSISNLIENHTRQLIDILWACHAIFAGRKIVTQSSWVERLRDKPQKASVAPLIATLKFPLIWQRCSFYPQINPRTFSWSRSHEINSNVPLFFQSPGNPSEVSWERKLAESGNIYLLSLLWCIF